MATSSQNKVGKTKTLVVFITTIMLGYFLFIVPDVFFGVTKINGGKTGINLFYMAIFQLISIVLLLTLSIKILKKDWKYIGLKFDNLSRDVPLGLLFGGVWTLLQFTLLIPNTGGPERVDVSGMLDMYNGSLIGTLSFVALGVIGGGITEELFNRGYFINILKDVFKRPKAGLWLASIISIILFAMGHMPTTTLAWFDILVPTIIYTLLFLKTRRLTASIIAHGIYNMSAILLVYHMYYTN